MNRRIRYILFFAGAIGVAIIYAMLIARIPGPNQISSPYGDAINRLTVAQRHITDAVTAVNFDYRGFDTIGEEYILFVSVMGALVLLRQAQEQRDDVEDAQRHSRAVPPSDAVRVWTLGLTGPLVLYGIYIVTHGQLTPGGGFQGGVVLATAVLLIYLAESFAVFKKITSRRLMEAAEAVGAGAYIVIGAIAWLWGREFLTNVIPLGQTGTITSGGMVPLISIAVGLEVSAGFVLLLYAFLQETLATDH